MLADKDEIRPQYANQDAPDANAVFASSIVRSVGPSIGLTIDAFDTQVMDIYNANELANVWYHDQVLPFDITLAGANEYDAMCAAKIPEAVRQAALSATQDRRSRRVDAV